MKITSYENFSKYLSILLNESHTYHWLKYRNTSIDLILDGGAFSGSYLLGGLIYLSNISSYLHIDRVSGTSVGSLFGLLYLCDHISKFNYKFYKKFRKCFKKKGNLSVLKHCLRFLKKYIPNDFYLFCNNKLYITFYDIDQKKQILQFVFSSNDDVISAVYKSCFIPLLINGKISIENKYIDGIYPYIFPESKYKHVIFMDLHSNYLNKMINIKNEKNNHHRILCGIFETHHFFMYGSSCLCSDFYKNKYYYYCIFKIRKTIAQYIVSILHLFQKYYLTPIKNNKNSLYIYKYIITHFKNIFPYIIKFIANNYLI